MRCRFVFQIVCLCLALCATTPAQKPPSLTPGSDYLILPGDVIEVQYRYTPEFNQTVTVQPDGYITLPIVGSVKVSEMTLEQARQLILKRAGERLQEPEATVTLKEFQKPYFVVAGEVAGQYQIGMGVLVEIDERRHRHPAAAFGFQPRADGNVVEAAFAVILQQVERVAVVGIVVRRRHLAVAVGFQVL